MFTTYADVWFRIPVAESFTYELPEDMADQAHPGSRVLVPFRGRDQEIAIIHRVHRNPPAFATKPVHRLLDPGFSLLTPELTDLADWIADYYMATPGEALHLIAPSGRRLKGDTRAALETYVETGERPPPPKHTVNSDALVRLSEEQDDAFHEIFRAPDSKENLHLLHGITGSGKTEVYIHAICRTLAAGRSALYLVPEITLTVQLINRLKRVFGDRLGVLHSYLPLSEKYDTWMKFRLGLLDVVLGTRSAVFAPLENPGLIIIDEEHDASYKEHSSPRYHARRVAFQRAARHQARVILGSATPAVETFYWSRDRGRIHYHALRHRPSGSLLPDVEVVHRKSDHEFISPELRQAGAMVLEKGEQAIFLLNRRGYSPQAYCSRCKITQQCPDCSLSLTFHQAGYLSCHFCGYREKYQLRCPVCQNMLELVGVGTQQAEEHLRHAFPDANITRLDQDVARASGNRSAVGEILTDLEAGKTDILLGTQMIAKGLDFPNVTLVAVLNADIGLGLPDFRSSERIFSLLVQVAGRAGRSQKKGRVIIQSLTPDLPLLRQATNQDYGSFYRQEIGLRREHFFPPFARMFRLVIRCEREEVLTEFSGRLRAGLEQNFSEPFLEERYGRHPLWKNLDAATFLKFTRLTGPLEAPVYKLKKYFRHHLFLQSLYPEPARLWLSELMAQIKTPAAIHLQFDVDPEDMM